ncbi:MAG: hypothetical protein CK538_09640 [Opitutia bacterium]|nr:hypothetical protein [Opitutaceae bacterium]PHX84893.1 MAG: hypothetical protein CK538_09640 [Opitutae bacterium]
MNPPLSPTFPRLRPRSLPPALVLVFCLFASVFSVARAAENLGLFTGRSDLGELKRPGTFAHDATAGTYTLGSAGLNMWARRDDHLFAWKKMTGDVALSAEIDFLTGGDPHRKGCIVIRQTLAADSVYVDAATHGDGLTSLQFREATGDITREVQARAIAPRRLRLDKIGDMVYLSLAGADGVFAPAGGSVKLPFTGEFYVGLAACAHNADGFVEVKFSHVAFGPTSPAVVAVRSSLETVVISSGDRRSVFATTERIEAPNWSKDGKHLYFNGSGRITRLPLTGPATTERIDLGTLTRANNDHGISPDGTQLVISDGTKPGGSRIYVLPITGGTPRELTPLAPSYWHGWSPDGLTHTFCGKRDGRFGIFTVPAAGGPETRLTTAATPEGLDDGPEYSPDGQWIYFNSDRTGLMQIWRMKPDGTAPEQITNDGLNNWFAHPSPNGRWLAYLTFAADVKGHPADKDVMIRLLPVASIGAAPGTPPVEPRVLVKLFGGQGTMNVPSWSPDSARLAYVRYQPAVR